MCLNEISEIPIFLDFIGRYEIDAGSIEVKVIDIGAIKAVNMTHVVISRTQL